MTGRFCQSCGMFMKKWKDYGGGDMNNVYCVHCTDAAGNIKSRDEIRVNMVDYMLKQGICQEEAERKADMLMAQAPAWRKKHS